MTLGVLGIVALVICIIAWKVRNYIKQEEAKELERLRKAVQASKDREALGSARSLSPRPASPSRKSTPLAAQQILIRTHSPLAQRPVDKFFRSRALRGADMSKQVWLGD